MENTIYPTPANEDGFFYQNKEEQEAEILTKEYENGSKVKKLTLSNGKEAFIRMLKGRDFIETKKRIQADNTADVETIGLSLATKIDDKQQPTEYYLDDLYQADYLKLFVAYGALNLQ